MSRAGLQIGELAARTGVSIHTVRYYERRKLLRSAGRTEGGFRLFAHEAIDRIRFVKQAQELGLSLDEIGLLLETPGRGECRQMRDLLRAKLEELDERMRRMRAFRRTLAAHLDACERALEHDQASPACPVVVELSHHGTFAAGGTKRHEK